jgi:DNA-binding transcriptional LysR family regulator
MMVERPVAGHSPYSAIVEIHSSNEVIYAMHIRSLDLNTLVVFRALMQHRNVTNAAAEIGLSQPAVSHALRRLRERYRDRLFVRLGGLMQPTERAIEIAGDVAEALKRIEATFQDEFDLTTLKRKFRIGFVDFAAIFFLPSLIEKIGMEAPGVDVVAEYVSNAAASQLLQSRDLDFAIGVVPPLDSAWRRHTLFLDTFVMIARRDHPEVGQRIGLKKYAELRHVRTPVCHIIDKALEARGVSRKFAVTADSIVSVPFIVSRSDLLGVMPSAGANVFADFCRLKVMNLPFKLDTYRIDLVWHRGSEKDKAHGWMARTIRVLASNLDSYLATRQRTAAAD